MDGLKASNANPISSKVAEPVPPTRPDRAKPVAVRHSAEAQIIENMIRECVEMCAQVADQHSAAEIAIAIRRLKPASRWP